MPATLIDQGLNLMLFGMGTVLVFLTVLVFATGLMSNLVNRLASPASDSPQPGNLVSPDLLQAIRQALAQHRGTES